MSESIGQTPRTIAFVAAALLVGGLAGRSCSQPRVGVQTEAEIKEMTARQYSDAGANAASPSPAAAAPQQTPVEPGKTDQAKAWFDKRPSSPALAYLFDGDADSLSPVGGTLMKNETDAKAMALAASGHVYLTGSGAVFLDGGRLLSVSAGEALTRMIRKSGRLSIEAILTPGDTRHDGPARIVSISRDGSVRNVTLGQDDSRWVVRLRTAAAGDNGTSPEHRCRGLSVAYTHVVATYDGRTVHVYVNAEKVMESGDGAGPLTSWADGFPLVIGNEAYEARDWAGVVRFVAVYDHALNHDAVRKLSKALPAGDPVLGTRLPAAPKPGSMPAGPEGVGDEREVF